VGLCTPTIEQIIEESSIETIEYESSGYTITTETTTNTTTTTVTNEDSTDILDGSNDYVVSSKEGDMDIDWGGQGPATMPSGNSCGQLGTDKCAMITGSGNSTSSMGVSNMGTTFINTVDISNLNITKGGEANYSIKVEKQDSQDSIYMHITGRDGKTNIFSGTDILSASGVDSGFKTYTGGFDFGGSLTTIIIEVGGRDINLAVGPMFDDVQVNVLYNVVNTIVQQTITSVEMFFALNTDAPEEVIEVVESEPVIEENTDTEVDRVDTEEDSVEDDSSYLNTEIIEKDEEITTNQGNQNVNQSGGTNKGEGDMEIDDANENDDDTDDDFIEPDPPIIDPPIIDPDPIPKERDWGKIFMGIAVIGGIGFLVYLLLSRTKKTDSVQVSKKSSPKMTDSVQVDSSPVAQNPSVETNIEVNVSE